MVVMRLEIIIFGLVLVLAGMVVGQGEAKEKCDVVEGLNGEGWVMYGASWCSACTVQKGIIGDGVDGLNYVDCDKEGDKCVGVKYIPTWINTESGEMVVGVLEIEELSVMAGCVQ